MGVKGLTSYVNQSSKYLAQEVAFKPIQSTTPTNPNPDSPTLVIDAWAWLFQAYLNNFHKTLKGGEYLLWSQHIRDTINVWRSLGLNFVFIWDGPEEPRKIPTILSRISDQLSKNLGIIRSSPITRSNLKEHWPGPLSFDCAVSTLRELKVEQIFAEGEADGLVAETADRLKGYACSQDSDFFILCSRARGCKGYVPLESFEYRLKNPSQQKEKEKEVKKEELEDDGFSPVKKSKGRNSKRNEQINSPILNQENEIYVSYSPPPSTATSLEISPVLSSFNFKCYSPLTLASHLEIPSTLLPLLASLLGNDFTSSQHQRMLFSNLGKGIGKVVHVSNALRTEWINAMNPKKSSGNSSKNVSGSNTPLAAPSKSESGKSTSSQTTTTPAKEAAKLGSKLSTLALANATACNASVLQNQSSNSVISDTDAATISGGNDNGVLDPVKSLVQSVVERLLEANSEAGGRSRDLYVSSGEKEVLIEGIIQGLASYSLLAQQQSSASISNLSNPAVEFFQPELGTSFLFNESSISKRGLPVIKLYKEAFLKGHFHPSMITALTSRHWITRQFLEDPDTSSAQSGPSRRLRKWVLSVLFDAWGMNWARETMESPKSLPAQVEVEDQDDEELEDQDGNLIRRKSKWIGGSDYASGEDPDDLISVIDESSAEEDMESLKSDDESLRDLEPVETEMEGGLKPSDIGLDASNLPSRPGSVSSEASSDDANHLGKNGSQFNKPPPAILEYVRKGNQLKPELVRIRNLSELLRDEIEEEGERNETSLNDASILKIRNENFNPLPTSLGDLLAQHQAANSSLDPVRNGEEESMNASISTIKSDPFPSPMALQPLSTRMDLYLLANHSNIKSLSSTSIIPKQLFPLVTTLRFLVIEGAIRWGTLRKKNNWKRKEIEAALKTSLCSFTLNQKIKSGELKIGIQEIMQNLDWVVPTTRSIHFITTLQLTLETNQHLLQALLLEDGNGSFQTCSNYVDGSLLHFELFKIENPTNANSIKSKGSDVSSQLPEEGFGQQDEEKVKAYLNVLLEGLEDLLGIDVEEERRIRKAEKKKLAKIEVKEKGNSEIRKKGGNLFDMLGEE